MKILVTGTRRGTRGAVALALDENTDDHCYRVVVVHGAQTGADEEADAWARENSIPVESYPADWKLGPQAGPIRNQRMIDDAKPDLVLAFPDKKSIGTWDCVKKAVAAGIQVRIYPVKE